MKRGVQAVRRRARARVANGAAVVATASAALARTSTSLSANMAISMVTASWQGRRLGLLRDRRCEAADGLHNEEQEERNLLDEETTRPWCLGAVAVGLLPLLLLMRAEETKAYRGPRGMERGGVEDDQASPTHPAAS